MKIKGSWIRSEPEVSYVTCSHKSPYGIIKSEWKKSKNVKKITFSFTIPTGTEAAVILPDGKERKIKSSKSFILPL